MEEKCTICLKNIKTKSSKTLLTEKFATKCKCKYYYHNRCIKTWMRRKKTCPTCRETIFDNKYDMYKNSIKNFFWIIIVYYFKFILLIHKPFLIFVGSTTFFSFIALLFLNLEIFIKNFLRIYLLKICYISWFFIIPTFLILQFYRINSYRINLYIRNA
jgi:hypothetical protein